jgi:hypothetical protein
MQGAPSVAASEDDDTRVKIWHVQQEVLLKEWAEVSSSYRWLHDRAHKKYRRENMWFVLPVIVLSTITGTMSFAQNSFPENLQEYVPLCSGSLNIFAGMLSTIAQFLRVSQLVEAHRVASLAFGKLSRAIRIELALPCQERSADGRYLVKTCRSEMDRLLEQSPQIPSAILGIFERTFALDIAQDVFFTPEIMDIHPVNIYDPTPQEEEKKRVADIVACAAVLMNSAGNRKGSSVGPNMGTSMGTNMGPGEKKNSDNNVRIRIDVEESMEDEDEQ